MVTCPSARDAGGPGIGCLTVLDETITQLVDSMPDGILLVDSDGRIHAANAQAGSLFGCAPDQLVGQSVEMLIPDRFRRGHAEHRARYRQTEAIRPMGAAPRLDARRKDGSEFPAEISLAPFKKDGKRFTIAAVRDVSSRVESLQALRASEERHRQLFACIPLPAFVHDTETHRFVSVNQAAVDHYGYTRQQFLAMQVTDLAPTTPKLSTPAKQHSQGDDEQLDARRHQKRDGSLIDVEVVSHALLLEGRRVCLSIARDITETRRLEEQLRQSQRLEAIGRLAGGVAHDFNNALMVVLGISSVLLDSLQPGDPMRAEIEDIRKAGERAAALTKQLLAFSRKQVMEPRPIDLNAVVADIDRMLRRLVGENIELSLHLGSSLGTVLADPTHLEQVIVNLVVNARDAMPDGGKLAIETADVQIDEEYARSHVDVTPGPHVMLAVVDTGVGMDEETRAHIFEPFFTTKQSQGTGLGLATVHGIVRQMGGHIWVYAEPGKGSTFKVYLPSVPRQETFPVQRSLAPRRTGGTETVLVVEDDSSVRRIAVALLARLGYLVLTARNGAEALQLYEHHPEPIHLLLTDVVMPEMTGRELADCISRLRPEIRVLYMSGYTDNTVVHHGVLEPNTHFIQKPFSLDAIARKVREVLDAPTVDKPCT